MKAQYTKQPWLRWLCGLAVCWVLGMGTISEAQAAPRCGGQTAQSSCGRSNFCLCCNGACSNCVWWAWEAACRTWKFAFPTCNDAHRWNEQARGRGEPTGSQPRSSSVFVCEKSGTCSQWGHVGWVVTAHSNGSFSSTEQSCGGACTTSSRTRPAGFATGGFIYNPKGPSGCTSDSQCKDPAKPKCSGGSCVAKPSPPPAGCTYIKIARTGGLGLRIRASATTQSSQVGLVGDGTCLKVQAKTTGQTVEGNSTWYKISHGGVTGWVSAKYADCSSCGAPPPPPPECKNGESRSCYTGPSGTKGKGICKAGTQRCSNDKWGSCQGEVKPAKEETCDNQKDDNCNGQVDEQCTVTGSCEDKDGDGHKSGRGCLGVMDCDDTRKDVFPGAPEICGNKRDDNCNGAVDEDCSPDSCDEGKQKACYTGPSGTLNVGACKSGIQTCHNDAWGPCEKEVTPIQEICGNALDDNCDGAVDEDCPSHPESTGGMEVAPVPWTPDVAPSTSSPTPSASSPPNPRQAANNSAILKLECADDKACPSGQSCVQGQCRAIKPSGACGCSTSQPTKPNGHLWLLALCLLWLIRLSRREASSR